LIRNWLQADPAGSGRGFRQSLLILQSNDFNQSAIRTVICAVVSSNLRLEEAPGNVRVRARAGGLGRESVVNVSQLITVDRRLLTERIGRLGPELMRDVDSGVRLALAL
jgi:mRNA interferase MazF